jgi:flagellar motor switch protein FliM
MLELLMGGSTVTQTKIEREISEIEQAILENAFKIMLRDLREAWKGIAVIDFSIESYETEPQLMQLLAPNEAIVAISIEIRLGEVSGMMNIGIPSIIIKMLSHKFAEQWTIRKTQPTEEEQLNVYRRIRDSEIEVDARLRGPKLTLNELLNLKAGDVLAFDYPAGRDLDVELNGLKRYECQIAVRNKKRAVRITNRVEEVDEILQASLSAGPHG